MRVTVHYGSAPGAVGRSPREDLAQLCNQLPGWRASEFGESASVYRPPKTAVPKKKGYDVRSRPVFTEATNRIGMSAPKNIKSLSSFSTEIPL